MSALTLEQIEARRAELRQKTEQGRAEQYAIDMARLLELEEEFGYDAIEPVQLSRWTPGAATMMVARIPRSSEAVYKRYQHQAASDKASTAAKIEAGELLAKTCLVYPAPKTEAELFAATTEFAPGILGHVALQIVRGVQGREREEGK